MGTWISGGIIGLVGMIGLLVASRAHGGAFATVGLLLFVLGVLLIYGLIHRNTGHPKA